MLILAVETSGRTGSIALCRHDACLAERELQPVGRRHAQSLVLEIRRMLDDVGLAPGDCEAVAVSIGPGSFTGLRVGVTCAKTFAYATGGRLAAVDTFQCIAANTPPDVGDVYVIGDAQREDAYVGRYRREPGSGFEPVGEIGIVGGSRWCAQRGPDDVVTGPGLERFEAELAGRCRVLPAEARRPTALGVARLGAQRLGAGISDDIRALEPFYLRKSAAEEKWDVR